MHAEGLNWSFEGPGWSYLVLRDARRTKEVTMRQNIEATNGSCRFKSIKHHKGTEGYGLMRCCRGHNEVHDVFKTYLKNIDAI